MAVGKKAKTISFVSIKVLSAVTLLLCGFGIYGCGDSQVKELEKLIVISNENLEACQQYIQDGYKMKKGKDGYVYVTNIDLGIESCGQAVEYCKKLDEKFMEFSKLPSGEFMDFLSSEHGEKTESTRTQQFSLSMEIPLFYKLIINTIDKEYLRKAFVEPIDQEKKDYVDKITRFNEIGEDMSKNMRTHTNAMSEYFKEK